jgi:hypothetical protein
MNNSEIILDKIKNVQKNFYDETDKHIFFKKKQKLECATAISHQIDLDELLHYSMYILPNTNRLFIDYTVLKTFMHSDIYEKTVNKFIQLIDECVHLHGSYEAHINIDSLTISAFERYQPIFSVFFTISDKNGRCYSDNISKCEILNMPSFGELLFKMFKPFMNHSLKGMIRAYNKKESIEKITLLFSS